MKIKNLIVIYGIVTLFLLGCSSTKERVLFFNSESDIPQVSKNVRTNFQIINKEKLRLPISIYAAVDSNCHSQKKEYYILITKNFEIGKSKSSSKTFIDQHYIAINKIMLEELIDEVNKSIIFFDNQIGKNKGTISDYQIVKEHNVKGISNNVEQLFPYFRFSSNSDGEDVESFIYIIFNQNSVDQQELLFSLTKNELYEFLYRLVKSLEVLKEMGMLS